MESDERAENPPEVTRRKLIKYSLWAVVGGVVTALTARPSFEGTIASSALPTCRTGKTVNLICPAGSYSPYPPQDPTFGQVKQLPFAVNGRQLNLGGVVYSRAN